MIIHAEIHNHVVQRLRVPNTLRETELWVIDNVLAQERISSLTPAEQIYASHSKFKQIKNKYLNNWNSARSDLIVDLIPVPKPLPIVIDLELKPSGDISLWLCKVVLRFTAAQLQSLVPVDLEDPRRDLLPILHESMTVLRTYGLTDQSELVQYYHRTRYLLLRYYIDAHYHNLKRYQLNDLTNRIPKR